MTNGKTKNDSNELMQLVSFELNKEEFAIDIVMVQEIIRMVQITKVPNSPNFIEGVINIRGRIIPVVDLRCKLGMSRKVHDKDTRVVIVDVLGKITGFTVDKVIEVLRIPTSIIESPPPMITNDNSEFIQSIGKLDERLLILINLQKLLSQTESQELQKVA